MNYFLTKLVQYSCEAIKTDIGMTFPEVTYGRIAPRSSLAFKHQISVGGGVLQTLILLVKLKSFFFYHSAKSYEVNFGDHIVQIIFKKIGLPKVVEADELPSSERGGKSFGSTGKWFFLD